VFSLVIILQSVGIFILSVKDLENRGQQNWMESHSS